jgi:hypothetical protein
MLPLFVYAALTAFGETPVRLRKKKLFCWVCDIKVKNR